MSMVRADGMDVRWQELHESAGICDHPAYGMVEPGGFVELLERKVHAVAPVVA